MASGGVEVAVGGVGGAAGSVIAEGVTGSLHPMSFLRRGPWEYGCWINYGISSAIIRGM